MIFPKKLQIAHVLSVLTFAIVMASCASTISTVQSDDRQTAKMLRAAEQGSRQGVRRELDHGVPIESTDKLGRTALHIAADRGHDKLVRMLIYMGASVDTRDGAGNTPLHLAAAHDHGQVCQHLLAGGASRTAKNNHGNIPADIAGTKTAWQLQPKSD